MNRWFSGLVAAHYTPLARSFFFILGCMAVWWGIVAFSVFWQQSPAERIASRIVAGDPFGTNILAQQLPIIEKSAYCRPIAVQSAAIIRLRMVEAATANNDRERADENLKSLGNAVRRSLSCAPADPFLWLVLWWIENTQNGFRPDDLKYLQMSYRLGPNEGWIALKRNRLVFSIFEQLPDDLTEDSIDEFISLLQSGLYGQAVEILTGPAWRVRNLILGRLKDLPKRTRENFAKVLDAQGYDLVVPGIEVKDGRRPELRLP